MFSVLNEILFSLLKSYSSFCISFLVVSTGPKDSASRVRLIYLLSRQINRSIRCRTLNSIEILSLLKASSLHFNPRHVWHFTPKTSCSLRLLHSLEKVRCFNSGCIIVCIIYLKERKRRTSKELLYRISRASPCIKKVHLTCSASLFFKVQASILEKKYSTIR